MYRLEGFDYSSPYYYMVTLKKREGIAPFSRNVEGTILETPITKALIKTILDFHKTWFVVEPIRPFAIIWDHIHLLIKIRNIPERRHLGKIIQPLMKALSEAYWSAAPQVPVPTSSSGASSPPSPSPIFKREWDDRIILHKGQLFNENRYIIENAARHYRRQVNRDFFRVIPGVSWLGHDWFAYGNLDLLETPVIEPFRCSRSIAEGSREWLMVKERASRIGEDAAGIGTFMSPLEKVARREIIEANGNLIVLEPQTYAERGHPPREYEKLCADGRALFLSLWPAETKKLDKPTMYKRCHELGDIVTKAFGRATV